MFILYIGDYEALLWVLITWPKFNPQSWNCLWAISHSDSSLNAKCQQYCHFCRVDEKKLVARLNEFLCHFLEILQCYCCLKLEVVVGKKVDSRSERAVFPAPGKICDFINRACLGFCLLFLKMLKGLASYLLCHVHWVQSSYNSNFSVSTLTIPHTLRTTAAFFPTLCSCRLNLTD